MLRLLLFFVMFWPPPALARRPQVITDIAPVQALVATVMAGVFQPVALLARGEEPHNFQLRPSQARAIVRADLLVWIGPELTPWLARALNGLGGHSRSLILLRVAGTHLLDYGPDEGGGLNPHAWLDPKNAQIWLGAIADALARIDPENAAIYAANTKAAQARLTVLTADLTRELADARDKPIVVFHDAYSYFAKRFGLMIAGAIRLGDATTPGAAHMAALRARLKQMQVACAFGEPQEATAQIDSLLTGTKVKLGVLDPSGSLLERTPALYETLLRGLADSIRACTG